MQWIEVVLSTTREGVDLLGDALLEGGASGYSVEDSAELAEFIAQDLPFWQEVDEALLRQTEEDFCRLVVYLADNDSGRQVLAGLPKLLENLRKEWQAVDFGSLAISVSGRKEDEWFEAWKPYYKPFPVGKRLFVCPEWEEIPAEAAGRVVFRSNPGMAFGSGDHATTKLCMEALEAAVSGGESVLDIGCGSGILSIVAALLGAKEVFGTDIDQYAAEVATKNAESNQVSAICRFFPGNALAEDFLPPPPWQFDLTIANIVADVLIPLAKPLARWTKPGGKCLLSGVLQERIAEVAGVYQDAGFSVLEQTEENDWCALLLTKN